VKLKDKNLEMARQRSLRTPYGSIELELTFVPTTGGSPRYRGVGWGGGGGGRYAASSSKRRSRSRSRSRRYSAGGSSYVSSGGDSDDDEFEDAVWRQSLLSPGGGQILMDASGHWEAEWEDADGRPQMLDFMLRQSVDGQIEGGVTDGGRSSQLQGTVSHSGALRLSERSNSGHG
jgi:hypothetical protein